MQSKSKLASNSADDISTKGQTGEPPDPTKPGKKSKPAIKSANSNTAVQTKASPAPHEPDENLAPVTKSPEADNPIQTGEPPDPTKSGEKAKPATVSEDTNQAVQAKALPSSKKTDENSETVSTKPEGKRAKVEKIVIPAFILKLIPDSKLPGESKEEYQELIGVLAIVHKPQTDQQWIWVKDLARCELEVARYYRIPPSLLDAGNRDEITQIYLSLASDEGEAKREVTEAEAEVEKLRTTASEAKAKADTAAAALAIVRKDDPQAWDPVTGPAADQTRVAARRANRLLTAGEEKLADAKKKLALTKEVSKSVEAELERMPLREKDLGKAFINCAEPLRLAQGFLTEALRARRQHLKDKILHWEIDRPAPIVIDVDKREDDE